MRTRSPTRSWPSPTSLTVRRRPVLEPDDHLVAIALVRAFSIWLPANAPPSAPAIVAAVFPLPLPIWCPRMPPAMPPMTAPRPGRTRVAVAIPLDRLDDPVFDGLRCDRRDRSAIVDAVGLRRTRREQRRGGDHCQRESAAGFVHGSQCGRGADTRRYFVRQPGDKKHRGGVPLAPGQLSGETAACTAWNERYVASSARAVGLARVVLWRFLLRRRMRFRDVRRAVPLLVASVERVAAARCSRAVAFGVAVQSPSCSAVLRELSARLRAHAP